MERYEALRDQALDKNRISQELVLFLRNGMMAWHKAWKDCIQIKQFPKKDTSQTKMEIPHNFRKQIIILLANMTINGRRGVQAL